MSKRIPQFAYARTIACIAIVFLHCVNSGRVYHADAITPQQTAGAFAACSALMWAVPCFLMVTGALLFDPSREIGPKKLFGKYIRRMVEALVVFNLIFTLIKHESGQGSIFKEFFDGLLFNHCMAYLWYLYLMIALYLLMPLFKRIVDTWTERRQAALGAALIIIAALPLLNYLGVDANLDVLAWAVYPAYLFAGRALYRKNINWRFAAAAAVITTIAMPLITIKLSATGIDPSGLTAYNSPLVVIQSLSIFSLMLRITKDEDDIVASIDRCSFGIYLIHMIFLRLAMVDLGFDPFMFGPFGFIGLSIIAFLLSWALTYGLKKLRFIDFL